MNELFQDKIDDYLLGRMTDAAREAFVKEVEQDEEKKEQLELTRNVRDCICSREEKLRAMTGFRQRYESERRPAVMMATGTEDAECSRYCMKASPKPVWSRRRVWLWGTGVAAVFAAVFFSVRPLFEYESAPESENPMEQMRGGDDAFDAIPSDDYSSVDSIYVDSVEILPDKKLIPSE